MLHTLKIVPCEREGERVPESFLSWRIRVEAMAGFVWAHFIMLVVQFLIITFIYWTLSMCSFRLLRSRRCRHYYPHLVNEDTPARGTEGKAATWQLRSEANLELQSPPLYHSPASASRAPLWMRPGASIGYLIESSQSLSVVGYIVPISQPNKLKLRKVEWLAQRHSDSQRQN